MLKQRFKKNMSLNKMKLAPKTAMYVSIAVILCFSIFIIIATTLTRNALEKSSSSEFMSGAGANAARIQATFDMATSLGVSLQEYINDKALLLKDDTEHNGNSEVYSVPLSETKLGIESFAINTIKALVKNNEEFSGGGLLFEPDKFDKQIPTYAFFVNENNINGFKKLPKYEEYGNYDWYKTVKDTKKMYFSDTYQLDGKYTVTAAFPLFKSAQFIGVCAVDIKVEDFNDKFYTSEEYPTMYASVYSGGFNSCIYSSTSTDYIGGNLLSYVQPEEKEIMINGANKKELFECDVTEGGNRTRFTFYPITAGNQTWWSQNAVQVSDLNSQINVVSLSLICTAILAILVIVFITVIVLKKLISPIDNVVLAAEKISKGNFDIELNYNSEDEIGILTRTFDKTCKMLKALIHDISNVLNAFAEKDLSVETNAEYVGDLKQIEDSIHNITDNLNIIVGNLIQTSAEVTSGAQQVSSGAQALSQGATEQAASIEELSATISDIAEKVSDNADNAQLAKKTSEEATKVVLEGNEQMKELLTAMEDISQKAGQIGHIIKTIDDIAFQTNILSLNAAVEAARAGAAGKGFAVVADEVRNLATKSADAAKDTTSLINGSIQAVTKGKKLAQKTASFLDSIVEGANQSTELLDGIAQASEEQANAVSQINQGVEQISSVVQTNSATAEESAAASEQLTGQAVLLRNMVDEFRLKDEELV